MRENLHFGPHSGPYSLRFESEPGWEIQVASRYKGEVILVLKVRPGFNRGDLLVQRYSFLNPALFIEEAEYATQCPTEVWQISVVRDEDDELEALERAANLAILNATKVPKGVLKF